MNALIGEIAVGIALVVALATIGVSFVAVKTGSKQLSDIGRHGMYVVTAALLVAAAVLVNAFLTHDFSLKYVQNYSDARMPTMYLVAAFWGGQAGSLLFWAVTLAVASSIAVTTARRRVPDLMPWVYVILLSVIVFFLVLLVFLSSPFETYYLIDPPEHGGGLNPVLQNYWMSIHPPSLLTGYATFAIPFAFGAAAMLKGRMGIEWIKVTRRWLLISWTFLSLGCLLGARWAYEELGWGGMWAWDPVENAAILPWFTATALIHSVIIQERRGMLKRWNFSLLVLTFWLTIFGTFLTRSGMIASVHSFAESAIGPAFLAYVIVIAVTGIALLALRWGKMGSDERLDSWVSREAVFVLNNWIMLALMFVTLWGTLGPKVSDLFTGEDSVLGATWFNKFVFPIGLAILFFMAVGTLIAWRRATMKNFRRNFVAPLIVSVVISAAVGWLYVTFRLERLQPELVAGRVWMAGIALFLAVCGIAVIWVEFWRGVRSRRKKTGGGYAAALFSLMSKHRRRYGGYLVHLGFILFCVGMAGNAFKVSQQVTLRVGDTVPLGDYLLTFEGIETEEHTDKFALFAALSMRQCTRLPSGDLDAADCTTAVPVRPARFDYNDRSLGGQPDPMKVTSEIAIHTSLMEDVYIAISGYQTAADPTMVAASFDMFVNPLMFWIWFGGVILVASVVLCMWPERVRVRHRRRRQAWKPLLDTGAMILVALIPVATLLSGPSVSAQVADDEHDEHDEHEGHDHAQEPTPQVESIDEFGQRMIAPTRTEGSDEAALYSLISCQCPGCGRKAIDQCQPSCAWGRDARRDVNNMVADGRSREEILVWFEEQYGAVALTVPDDAGLTWWVPAGGVAVGSLVTVFAVVSLSRSKRRRQANDEAPAADSADENNTLAAQLAAELAELD